MDTDNKSDTLSKSEIKALLKHTSEIVSAYVGQHDVKLEDMPSVIQVIYDSLSETAYPKLDTVEARPDPAVPIEESLTDDAIICLEDGLSFQSLKRHLRVKYNMTPEAYRKKWDLPVDYPMVAPNYAKRRSALAKRSGLGKSR